MKDIPEHIVDKLKQVKLLALDFDGVMTNNKVFVTEDGKEFVICNRSDGMGISLLKKFKDIEVVVISTETNKVVDARCGKLAVKCFQGIKEKDALLQKITLEMGLQPKNIAFIGNDVNDLKCIKDAGIGIVVADAHENVKSAADLILTRNGGDGAVREFCDLLMEQLKC